MSGLPPSFLGVSLFLSGGSAAAAGLLLWESLGAGDLGRAFLGALLFLAALYVYAWTVRVWRTEQRSGR